MSSGEKGQDDRVDFNFTLSSFVQDVSKSKPENAENEKGQWIFSRLGLKAF